MNKSIGKSKYDGFVQRTTDWNFQSGIIKHKNFDLVKESANTMEEVLESLGLKVTEKTKKAIINKLTIAKKRGCFGNKSTFEEYTLDDLAEVLDGCGDAIVVLIGTMSFILYLVGYEQKAIGPKIVEILNTIMTHNELKKFKYDSEIGKLVKEKDFDNINSKTLPQLIIKNLLITHSQRLMKKERKMATKKSTESTKKATTKKEVAKKTPVKKEAIKKASKPVTADKKKPAVKKTTKK